MHEMYQIYVQVAISIFILGFILLILAIVTSHKWINRKIVKPIIDVTATMKIVADGMYDMDLSYDYNDNFDEIQELYGSLKQMVKGFRVGFPLTSQENIPSSEF